MADAVGVSVGDLGKIMARQGEELEGSVEERMLKNSGDLVKEGLLHTDQFGKMIFWLQAIAAVVSVSGLTNLFSKLGVGKFFKGKGPLTKSGKPDMRFKANKVGKIDDAAKVASKTGFIAKTMQKGKTALDAVKTTAKGMKGQIVDTASKVVSSAGLGKITSWMSKNLGKQALKKIPVLGALPAVAFAGYRAMQGDFAGAGLEIASGASNLANLVAPGFGSAGALAIDGLIMARDMGVDVGFAKGGVVPKTGTYMVGEQGPEMVAMSKGSHVVPNHRLSGGYASGTNTDVMKQTNEKLDTLIALMSNVDTNTGDTATGVNNINIRTGR
jgi:phage-related tail protein